MKTKAVRIYGVNDLRLEEFELPEIKDDEILAEVVSDSICMSSHKLSMQGAKHKRVRHDLTKNPIIIGGKSRGKVDDFSYVAHVEPCNDKRYGRFRPGLPGKQESPSCRPGAVLSHKPAVRSGVDGGDRYFEVSHACRGKPRCHLLIEKDAVGRDADRDAFC